MHRPILLLALRSCISLLALALLAPNMALAAGEPPFFPSPRKPASYAPADLDAFVPQWGNPFLSYLPEGAEPEYTYWMARMREDARQRRAAQRLTTGFATKALTVNEVEPNDTQAGATFVDVGTGAAETPAATLNGSLAGLPAPFIVVPLPEDEGSIPLATPLALTSGDVVQISGTIGDGAYGSSGTGTGDLDFFALPGLLAGQELLIDVDTPLPFGDLDPIVIVWNSPGNIVAVSDDDAVSFDSQLLFTVPADGTYYVSVSGAGGAILMDPFDSSSGVGVIYDTYYGLALSEGTYDITLALDAFGDIDYYSFDLEAGDIVSASGPTARLTLYDGSGTELMGSSFDVTIAYPPGSPLLGGGESALGYIVPEAGTYAMRVVNVGAINYTVDLEIFRSSLERLAIPDKQQILFIDFDGATFDTMDPFGPATLSPLSSFLANWGLGPGEENAVIDAIMATVEEDLRADMLAFGNNPNFGIDIRNSRDHADPWGQPFVSRIVVGGTIPELGIGTIGIAESIDTGNYGLEETAVVLLDNLSDPNLANPNSLNSFPLELGTSIIDLIGVAVGGIVAHEAGHYFGNWHTEQFVTEPQIMDQGGNLPGLIGIGPDGIFGSADDTDTDFGTDIFNPNELFTGIEHTAETTAFALTRAPSLVDIPVMDTKGLLLLVLLLGGLGTLVLRRP